MPGLDEPALWLVLTDDGGVGAAVVEQLRGRGQRVHAVSRPSGGAPGVTEWGAQFRAHLGEATARAGIIDCWPLDIPADGGDADEYGAITVLRLAKALAAHDGNKPRLFLVTANAQPAAGVDPTGLDQAPSGDSAGSSAIRSSPNTGAP